MVIVLRTNRLVAEQAGCAGAHMVATSRRPRATNKTMTRAEQRALDTIPQNWCDPLLTGPRAVIGKPPYDCRDIERLLLKVRADVQVALQRAKRGNKR